MSKSVSLAENTDNPKTRGGQRHSSPNAVGSRILDALAGRPRKWLAEKAGISESTVSDYIAKGIAKADAAVAIARALGVSVDWLLTGNSDIAPNRLVSALDADWVELDEYDLRQMDEDGKGEAIGRATFRRDWLYLMLGESSGLWITRTLTPDPARGLPSGAAIVCKDHPAGEPPIEGQHYIFRVNGGVLLARFSYRVPQGQGEAPVTPADLESEDHRYYLVARVLGAVARPFV